MQDEALQPEAAAVLNGIRKIVQALRQASRQAEQRYGLSGAQLFVLEKLAEANTALTLGEIASLTLTHPSSVSVVVARLVERGLVLRGTSRHDGRAVVVRLSARGLDFLGRTEPETIQGRLATALAKMAPEERRQLAELMGKLLFAADLAGEEPAMFFEEDGDQGRKN